VTTVLPYGDIFPAYSAVYVPSLPLLGLSEQEQATISRLQARAWRQRSTMLLHEAYYQGEQVLTNLGIALPPELDGLRVVLGWPSLAVDPYVERLSLDSFRLASSTEADETLTELRIVNNMDAEESVAFTEALSMGRAWWTIHREPDAAPGDLPCVRAESPLNIGAEFDLRRRVPKAVLQSYFEDGRRCAVLYTPEQTIALTENDKAEWEITARDKHNFGYVPVVRMSNRPRAADRDGRSEISTALMSVTDAACRTLLNLTAASEFYSVPQKLILGATEEDFIGSDGEKKSAWETYIGRILALQRDAEGALPEVKQFEAYDPSVFTKVLEMYASQAAGILGAPPQDLGLYTQGNPVSAEAAQVSESRRDRRAKRMQANFGGAMVEVAQMALRFMNDGELPAGYDRLAADWQDPQIVNFAGYADGMTKLMTEGALPRHHDVIMRKLGFNPVERRQMLKALAEDPGMDIIAAIGTAVATRAIRATSVLANAGQPEAPPGA
jgi:hypothetical protein